MYLVSLKSFLYAFIFGRNMHKGLNFLASLEPVKYLKPFLPKEALLYTTVFLLSILMK